jgi:hypothetical protein
VREPAIEPGAIIKVGRRFAHDWRVEGSFSLSRWTCAVRAVSSAFMQGGDHVPFQRVLGDEHPNQLTSMSTLGQVYQRQGKVAEADALYTKSLEGQRRVNGPEHLSTLNTMRLLGELRDDRPAGRHPPITAWSLSGYTCPCRRPPSRSSRRGPDTSP